MADILKDDVYRLNLIIMVLSWSASSFCFYIIGFYIKYIPGNMFVNVIIMSIADALSSISAGIIASRIGTRKTMFYSYALAAFSGVLLTVFDQSPLAIMIFMLVTKFGINCAFTLCYIINAEYFPAMVCSRIFGICNIFSRISTILSPLIAEVTPPVPMMTYVLVCTLSMIASQFLTKNDEIEGAL